MKTVLRKIFFYLGATLSVLLVVVLGFIEIRTLVAGDWQLAENPILSSLSYGFRSAFFVFALLVVINVIIFEVQADRKFSPQLIFIEALVLAGAGLSAFFYEWYIALALFASFMLVFLFGRIGKRE